MMDKRIYIIAVLAAIAVVLAFVRESSDHRSDSFSLIPSSKKEISGDAVFRMADTTLRAYGVKKENIRPMKNRNDVRVSTPFLFDPIEFVRAMRDSLEDYQAQIVSIENAKEKTSVVQIKRDETVLKSFIFSKQAVAAVKKGASPSVQKKQTR